ncbi:MAG: hypothetical protein ACREGG_00460 [Candidatus Saccharimonadales bacterium]
MRQLKKLLAYLLLLVLLAFPFAVYFNAQALSDYFALRNYTPPSDIATLASQDTMLPYTKHMFYLNHPQIVSSVAAFRQDCPDSPQTIVLGCYHPDQKGIYIYSVSDSQLYGVEQVTAAHEVLHAVYARLSNHDRTILNNELEDYYKNGLTDSRVIAEVKIYQQTEPNDVMDEMSCTFGTEIADLPSGLNTYYQKYFANRQTVVNFEQNYESEFTSRQSQINTEAAQLAQMKSNIDSEEQSLQTQLNQINSDRARLDSLRGSGQTGQYNASVDSYNSEVSVYNSGVDRLRSDISSYNQLVDQYNATATELASLQQSIDTRLTPQASQ